MKIIVQAEDAPPNIGGIANHVRELSRAMVDLGHSVRLLSTRKDVARRNVTHWTSRQRTDEGVDIHEVPIVWSPRMLLFERQLRARFTTRLRRWIRRREADVLTFHFWDFDSRVVRPLAGTCPIVFTNHSSQFLENVEDAGRRALLYDRIAFADRVIAPSNELRDRTIDVGYPADRCTYIPNGVDAELFRPDARAREATRKSLSVDASTVVCLCARRAVWKNGLVPFAHALKQTSLAPGERLLVLFAGVGDKQAPGGDNAYADELRKALADLPPHVSVRLLGDVSRESMRGLLAATDFAVVPSFREATSLAGLEAMASEIPLIASNVGGLPDLVTAEVNGLLVPAGEVSELSRAIDRMVQDREFRRGAGVAGRQRVLRDFTWTAVAKRTLEVYAQAIEQHRSRTTAKASHA